ncbi:hypothetical protein [Stackebrandtia nassauensis]|uniref:Uncharacterized protein n=1 Tax=Stackebrandtia nassauensis (strain DSM 44728 / CIP 108903 / NRRL B-16338 / NBRC 102104 / LLR-40K-21) TaxID=446470 RepID=D3PVT8_STANL|nr:hypothetical protein [Stackebrandtia nassauensis]ADD45059.1 hypothetical protein Snas_5427 [Stackebrandtia nassauensis DSM 44728]
MQKNNGHRIEVPPYIAEQISKFAKQNRLSRNEAVEEIFAAGLEALGANPTDFSGNGPYWLESTSVRHNADGEPELDPSWVPTESALTLEDARRQLVYHVIRGSKDHMSYQGHGELLESTPLGLPVKYDNQYWRIVKRTKPTPQL